MTDDPIIEEVHHAKDELAKIHAGDLHSLFEALREADALAGRTVGTGSTAISKANLVPGVTNP